MCKQMGPHCVLITDSTRYEHPDYTDRVSITIEDTTQLVFSFIINQLKLSDAGKYACEAGKDPRVDTTNFDLRVRKPEPELVYGDLRGSVTFDCTLGPEAADLPKYLCRVGKDKGCRVVVNTLGKRAQDFEGRVLLTSKGNRFFSVHITGLRKEDAGHYLCGAHSGGEPQEGQPSQAWQLFVNEGEA